MKHIRTHVLSIYSVCQFLLVINHDMMSNNNTSAMVTPKEKNNQDPAQFHFVLVHGFGAGAWGWYKVRTLLEVYGFKVTCIDLKGCGVDPTPPQSVRTFEAYNEPLINFFHHYSPAHNEKVILVGISAGGVSVTDASHKFSQEIHVAVYVAATMLKHGYATDQDRKDGIPESVATGKKPSPDRTIPTEEATLGSLLARPRVPIEAMVTAKFSGAKADSVPRVYIKTLQDQVLKPEQQDAMISRWPPAHVFTLDTGHSPTSSAPFLISGLLTKVTYMF